MRKSDCHRFWNPRASQKYVSLWLNLNFKFMLIKKRSKKLEINPFSLPRKTNERADRLFWADGLNWRGLLRRFLGLVVPALNLIFRSFLRKNWTNQHWEFVAAVLDPLLSGSVSWKSQKQKTLLFEKWGDLRHFFVKYYAKHLFNNTKKVPRTPSC